MPSHIKILKTWPIIILPLLAGAILLFTSTHSTSICADCFVVRNSQNICGISIFSSDHPSAMTDLLNRYGDNPAHQHHFELAGESGFNIIADGTGALLFRRINSRWTVPLLENLYQFEDRAVAKRWKKRLMEPSDAIDAFGDAMQKLADPKMPSDETAWRRWWHENGPMLEQAIFPELNPGK